uniref:Uncharacterized protein n=1 Tax=Arundo donax TaxID=35708 RepID=A0A0A9B2Y1_ARUDO
MHLMYLFLI